MSEAGNHEIRWGSKYKAQKTPRTIKTYLSSLPVFACCIPITVCAGSPMNEQFRLFRVQKEMLGTTTLPPNTGKLSEPAPIFSSAISLWFFFYW